MSEQIPSKDTLPEGLTTRDQWLCWRTEKRDGKQTKVPVDPTSEAFASTTDSSTWSDFETASDHASATATEIDGLGFVFTDDDPIVGVDLDDCRIPETGTTREWATDIIDRLDSFTEISPSGTGYHILVEGSLPDGRNRNGDIELYETARFFTVTGEHVETTPTTIETRPSELEAVHREHVREESTAAESTTPPDPEQPASSLSDEALVERAKAAANGEKFSRLWRGSTAGYDSHSEADMALCSLLAFWTGGDGTQMDRLFRSSGLMRDKWDERHFADGSTYGEKTIERAIAGTDECYDPTAVEETPANEAGDTLDARVSEISDASPELQTLRERTADRLDRIKELEAELQHALAETEKLQSELEAERQRRRDLEAELSSERESSESESWIPWR
jgi:primase-polymerase (primpol)-like protein